MKPVQPRIAAERDIDEIFEYCLGVGGPALAQRFVDAYDAAPHHVAQYPATGSQRHAATIGIKNLHFWLLRGFPYAVFYVERPDVLDVLRVLHQASDMTRHFS